MKIAVLVAAILFPLTSLGVGAEEKTASASPGGKGRPDHHPLKRWNGLPFVLVANGSGGETVTSDNLKAVLAAHSVPMCVLPIRWSRHMSEVRDHLDQEAQFAAAAIGAEWVMRIRKECPQSPIFLVGHSSGAHVVLRLAEMVPNDSLERVYLSAPSVSSHYDLTRALRSCRSGLVSFWSENDTALEIVADYFGTSDGLKTQCAGRVGFKVDRRTALANPELYGRFQQVQWREGMGGAGGHYIWTRETFLCRHLFPSLLAK